MTTDTLALSPRHWLEQLRAGIDHGAILHQVDEDARWSGRYLFLVIIAAGIAMLGLLLSSPAVVIGAMLLSPLMGPIVGLGFGLAVFDLGAMRRALVSLALGIAVAVGFAALLSWLSPLQTVTSELAARTRPNLFDLVVALLSGLAGTFATLRSKQGAIVGVAIATAVMPPLATVGFGLATWNAAVAGGAAFLFFTNLMAIALAAAAMARLYGFGATLSPRQGVVQGTLIMVTLVALAVPLGLALRQIAWESVAQRRVREALATAFPRPDRLGDVEIGFNGQPIVINALVFTAKPQVGIADTLAERLTGALGQKVLLELEQVPLGRNEAPPQELRQPLVRPGQSLAERLALVAGVPVESVLLDRQARLARVVAATLPGAGLATYRALERRIAATAPDWRVLLVPPPVPPAADDPESIVWAAERLDLAVVVSGGGALAETLAARGVQVDAAGGRGPVAVRWAVPVPANTGGDPPQ